MSHFALRSFLPFIAVLLVATAISCDDDTGTGSGDSGAPRLPVDLDLPADFPLYADMEVVRAFQLGENYVFEASAPAADYTEVLAFYEKELASAGWEVTGREDLEDQSTLLFTREGYSREGHLAAAADEEREGRVTMAIAFPLAELQEANAAQGDATPDQEDATPDQEDAPGDGEEHQEDDASPDEGA